MLNPLVLVREAVKAVPSIRYTLGIGGMVAMVAIIFSFNISSKIAIFGTVIMLLLMMVLVIFARATVLGGSAMRLPAVVLTWFSLILFMLTSLALFGSVFAKWPLDLTRLITEQATSINVLEPLPAIQPAANSMPTAKNELLKYVSLGAGQPYLRENLGTPVSEEMDKGLRSEYYSFDDYDLTIIYDIAGKVMQYGVFLKKETFYPAVRELEEVLNRSYYLGRETFDGIELGILNPIQVSPLASDDEPFMYYELLQETPVTDVSIRLEYIVKRASLRLNPSANAKVLDSIADLLQEMRQCQYSLPMKDMASYDAVQAKYLDEWRRTTRPNAFSVQRRLEDSEVDAIKGAGLITEKLCELAEI